MWDAFLILGSDRHVGMEEGPIPFTAIDRYAERYGISGRERFHRFCSMIMAIDAKYLSLMRERREAEKKKD